LKETGPRQLTIAFAENPSGGGESEPSDASDRRNFLLLKARSKKTRGPGTGVADTSRLLEEVASEANLATALLKVVRNKGSTRSGRPDGGDGGSESPVDHRRPAP
jgi:RNA-directed DNA polymerase